MIVVNHKINTIEKLKNTPVDCGVEIDLRPSANSGSKIILNHEPFEHGEDFEEFLKHYNHKLLILNVKSEGIELKVLELVRKYNIQDYFFLDVSFPFMIKYINQGITKFAVRFSEYEAIETCLNLIGKVEWVFIDNMTHLPTENDSFNILKKHFKLCIVSPELLKRDNEIEETKEIMKKYNVDVVLTDHIDKWK